MSHTLVAPQDSKAEPTASDPIAISMEYINPSYKGGTYMPTYVGPVYLGTPTQSGAKFVYASTEGYFAVDISSYSESGVFYTDDSTTWVQETPYTEILISFGNGT